MCRAHCLNDGPTTLERRLHLLATCTWVYKGLSECSVLCLRNRYASREGLSFTAYINFERFFYNVFTHVSVHNGLETAAANSRPRTHACMIATADLAIGRDVDALPGKLPRNFLLGVSALVSYQEDTGAPSFVLLSNF